MVPHQRMKPNRTTLGNQMTDAVLIAELEALIPRMLEDAECHRSWTTDAARADLDKFDPQVEKYIGDVAWHQRWMKFYEEAADILRRAAKALEAAAPQPEPPTVTEAQTSTTMAMVNSLLDAIKTWHGESWWTEYLNGAPELKVWREWVAAEAFKLHDARAPGEAPTELRDEIVRLEALGPAVTRDELAERLTDEVLGRIDDMSFESDEGGYHPWRSAICDAVFPGGSER